MTPSFVVDCSVVMAWLFDDEQDAYAEAILDRLRREAALVPSLCHLEAVNVLLTAERKKRISRAQTSRLIDFLDELPILTDEAPTTLRARNILTLGRDHGLTAYDAAYLELAVRTNLPLATLDQRLRKAARAMGLSEYKP